jgi:hypothetical protein
VGETSADSGNSANVTLPDCEAKAQELLLVVPKSMPIAMTIL